MITGNDYSSFPFYGSSLTRKFAAHSAKPPVVDGKDLLWDSLWDKSIATLRDALELDVTHSMPAKLYVPFRRSFQTGDERERHEIYVADVPVSTCTNNNLVVEHLIHHEVAIIPYLEFLNRRGESDKTYSENSKLSLHFIRDLSRTVSGQSKVTGKVSDNVPVLLNYKINAPEWITAAISAMSEIYHYLDSAERNPNFRMPKGYFFTRNFEPDQSGGADMIDKLYEKIRESEGKNLGFARFDSAIQRLENFCRNAGNNIYQLYAYSLLFFGNTVIPSFVIDCNLQETIDCSNGRLWASWPILTAAIHDQIANYLFGESLPIYPGIRNAHHNDSEDDRKREMWNYEGLVMDQKFDVAWLAFGKQTRRRINMANAFGNVGETIRASLGGKAIASHVAPLAGGGTSSTAEKFIFYGKDVAAITAVPSWISHAFGVNFDRSKLIIRSLDYEYFAFSSRSDLLDVKKVYVINTFRQFPHVEIIRLAAFIDRSDHENSSGERRGNGVPFNVYGDNNGIDEISIMPYVRAGANGFGSRRVEYANSSGEKWFVLEESFIGADKQINVIIRSEQKTRTSMLEIVEHTRLVANLNVEKYKFALPGLYCDELLRMRTVAEAAAAQRLHGRFCELIRSFNLMHHVNDDHDSRGDFAAYYSTLSNAIFAENHFPASSMSRLVPPRGHALHDAMIVEFDELLIRARNIGRAISASGIAQHGSLVAMKRSTIPTNGVIDASILDTTRFNALMADPALASEMEAVLGSWKNSRRMISRLFVEKVLDAPEPVGPGSEVTVYTDLRVHQTAPEGQNETFEIALETLGLGGSEIQCMFLGSPNSLVDELIATMETLIDNILNYRPTVGNYVRDLKQLWDFLVACVAARCARDVLDFFQQRRKYEDLSVVTGTVKQLTILLELYSDAFLKAREILENLKIEKFKRHSRTFHTRQRGLINPSLVSPNPTTRFHLVIATAMVENLSRAIKNTAAKSLPARIEITQNALAKIENARNEMFEIDGRPYVTSQPRITHIERCMAECKDLAIPYFTMFCGWLVPKWYDHNMSLEDCYVAARALENSGDDDTIRNAHIARITEALPPRARAFNDRARIVSGIIRNFVVESEDRRGANRMIAIYNNIVGKAQGAMRRIVSDGDRADSTKIGLVVDAMMFLAVFFGGQKKLTEGSFVNAGRLIRKVNVTPVTNAAAGAALVADICHFLATYGFAQGSPPNDDFHNNLWEAISERIGHELYGKDLTPNVMLAFLHGRFPAACGMIGDMVNTYLSNLLDAGPNDEPELPPPESPDEASNFRELPPSERRSAWVVDDSRPGPSVGSWARPDSRSSVANSSLPSLDELMSPMGRRARSSASSASPASPNTRLSRALASPVAVMLALGEEETIQLSSHYIVFGRAIAGMMEPSCRRVVARETQLAVPVPKVLHVPYNEKTDKGMYCRECVIVRPDDDTTLLELQSDDGVFYCHADCYCVQTKCTGDKKSDGQIDDSRWINYCQIVRSCMFICEHPEAIDPDRAHDHGVSKYDCRYIDQGVIIATGYDNYARTIPGYDGTVTGTIGNDTKAALEASIRDYYDGLLYDFGLRMNSPAS